MAKGLRYFLVFDAIKVREEYTRYAGYLQMRLHGRGDLSGHDLESDFPFYSWSYKEKAFGATDPLSEDSSIGLYVYPGLSKNYLTCEVNPADELDYRQDSGEYDGYLQNFKINYVDGSRSGPKHDVLKMYTKEAGVERPQKGLPILYWPDNTGGTDLPDVTWANTDDPAAPDNKVDQINVTVRYEDVSDVWALDLSTAEVGLDLESILTVISE